jgi:hypothetical protein
MTAENLRSACAAKALRAVKAEAAIGRLASEGTSSQTVADEAPTAVGGSV